jgi:hypothetical protein
MTKKTTNNQQPETHGIATEPTLKDRYNTNKTANNNSVCDLKTGMTAGSRKQADGFADHARDDEVLERS